jgi:hypothetical protein
MLLDLIISFNILDLFIARQIIVDRFTIQYNKI